MKRIAIIEKVEDAKKELAMWQRLAEAGCGDCEHYGCVTGCALAGGVKPPPEVIAKGCPEWVWDGVPFKGEAHAHL